MLVDHYSASDGDLFAHAFKKLNMGLVIGTRTWGGIVGISSALPLIDGGTLRRPEFTSYDAETGEWLIEGYGVDPDIEVDNDPYLEYRGKDEQLEKAIEIIIKQLDDFKGIPDIPPFPIK
jgi:tricorn protease